MRIHLSPSLVRLLSPVFILSILIAFTALWKGGKGLEATWILVGVSWLLTIASVLRIENGKWRIEKIDTQSAAPFSLWILGWAFVAWTILSYIFSSVQNYGLDEVLRDAALFGVFLSVVRLPDARRMHLLTVLRYVILIITIVACAIGIAVYVLQPVNRFVGTFFDYRFHTDYWPNAWGQYLILVLPVSIATLFSHAKGRISMSVCLALAAAIIASLFLSYSRGALMAFSGSLIVWVACTWWAAGTRIRPLALPLITGVSVCFLALAFFSFANGVRSQVHEVQSVTEKVTFTADEGVSSINERSQFWNQSFALSLQRPLLGWGPYGFRFVQPRLQEHVLATSDHPHNIILKLAMERGWPAAIFFIAFICIIFFGVIRTVLRHPEDLLHAKDGRWMPALAAGVLAVLVHNMIDYNLQFVGIVLPFWIFLALLAAWGFPTNKEVALQRKADVTLLSIVLIVTLWEGVFLFTSSLGRHAEARGDAQGALRWYGRSTFELFSRDMHLSRAGLLVQMDRLEDAEVALATYAGVNTQDARALKKMGDVHMARSQFAEAAASYGAAYDLHGWNDASMLHGFIDALHAGRNIDQLTTRKGDFDARLTAFASAIERNEHFIALSQNPEEVAASANLMAKAFPDDAPMYEVLAAAVLRKAAEEREKLSARAPGYLW